MYNILYDIQNQPYKFYLQIMTKFSAIKIVLAQELSNTN